MPTHRTAAFIVIAVFCTNIATLTGNTLPAVSMLSKRMPRPWTLGRQTVEKPRAMTLITVQALDADNSPLPLARLRLRNLISGVIEVEAITDQNGDFTFPPLKSGSYFVELVDQSGRLLATSVIAHASESVTRIHLIVRLPDRPSALGQLFRSHAATLLVLAAAAGVTAIAASPQPISPER